MLWLQKHPVVSVPDLKEYNAAFTAGPEIAFHILNSFHVALQSTEYTNIIIDAKFIVFGYSGDAFATRWAAEKCA